MTKQRSYKYIQQKEMLLQPDLRRQSISFYGFHPGYKISRQLSDTVCMGSNLLLIRAVYFFHFFDYDKITAD